MSIVPSTIAATQGAKEGQAGLASGLVNTSRQVGGGLGLAVLVTLATQHTTHLIGTGEQVPQALTHGFALAYLIGAGLAGAAALVTFTALRQPAHRRARRGPRAGTGDRRRARCASSRSRPRSRALTRAPIGAYTTAGAYSFVSAPSLHPPSSSPSMSRHAGELAPGYIFTANFYDLN